MHAVEQKQAAPRFRVGIRIDPYVYCDLVTRFAKDFKAESMLKY